jgi:hypothetical protein
MPDASGPPLNTANMIGHVVSVSGSTVEVTLYYGANELRIGDLVRIDGRGSAVFGIIQALSAADSGWDALRSCEVQLFGEIQDGVGRFQRGVALMPNLGSALLRATHEDLAHVFAPPKTAVSRIGTVHQDRSLPAYILLDELLGKHFAVLGTTGSGKSCSTTVILKSVLRECPAGHIILLDPHDEYSQAFGDLAERITPSDIELPYWLLDFDEIAGFMIPPGLEAANERAILKSAILESKHRYSISENKNWITVDTPVPYRLADLTRAIDQAMGKLEKPDGAANYLRLISRIQALQADKRYAFMFGNVMVKDTLRVIAQRLMRVPVNGKPITVFDLSGVPSEVTDVVVSALGRLVFDLAVWTSSTSRLPVLLVCEEAHRYVPRDAATGFAPTRRALARIAREGRKYGVSLCLITQRPSELDVSILSQCNTFFALRMNNERDQDFVRAVLPESAQGLIGSLPALLNQEAIAVGEGVSLPMRLRFNDLAPEERPRSATAKFSSAWVNDAGMEKTLAEAIDRWRQQAR